MKKKKPAKPREEFIADPEERERAQQRKYAVKTIDNLHREYVTSGAKGRKALKDTKDRIRILIVRDPGGLWFAGELLKNQIEKERTGVANFIFENDIYELFVDTVTKNADELKEYDEPTFNDDVATKEIISEFLAEKHIAAT